MSLSRSPSPQRGGGWASPGLNLHYNGTSRRTSPLPGYANGSPREVTWASAQARSAEIRSFQPRSQNFFVKHLRKVSSSLPRFAGSYAEKEKLGRGRWPSDGNFVYNMLAMVGKLAWRARIRVAIVTVILLLWSIFYLSRKFILQGCWIWLIRRSTSQHVPQIAVFRCRQQICHYTSGKHGRWCHGVEGTKRVGY